MLSSHQRYPSNKKLITNYAQLEVRGQGHHMATLKITYDVLGRLADLYR
jgi:hypothetical protein